LALASLNILQLILSLLALLLGFYVFSLRRPMALGVFLLVMAVHSGVRAFRGSLDYTVVVYSYALAYLYGPLIYLTLIDILKKHNYNTFTSLHFLPFVIAILSLKLNWLTPTDLGTALCMLSLGYAAYSYRELFYYADVVEHTRATGLPPEYVWLRRVIDLYSVFVAYQVARFMIGFIMPEAVINVFELGFFIGAVLFFSLIIFQGLRTASIIPELNKSDKSIVKEIKKKVRRNVSDEQRELNDQLTLYLQDEKPYLDPAITVQSLSLSMEKTPRQLSEMINDIYGYSFSELINRARVTEAQGLMAQDTGCEKTILDIAMEAGFNSKSSFNLMYKRYTQQTPSEYRRTIS
jgi:AraC-like DNA-binding protein